MTKSWSYPYLILGLPLLQKWGIVPATFPLPPGEHGAVMEITQEEVESVPENIGGKEVVFHPPKQRIFVEPDYGNSSAVMHMLANMREDILSDFAPAFSDVLGAGHVARVDPMTIELTDPTKNILIAKLVTPSHTAYLGMLSS